MKDHFEQEKLSYQSVEVPPALSFTVAAAIREGDRRRRARRRVRRACTAGLAGCACFCLLVNSSPALASALEQVPVLGHLARLVTVEEYHAHNRTRLIDVRRPALTGTGRPQLEEAITVEIDQQIDLLVEEAELRAEEQYTAFTVTGGQEEEFLPVIVTIDYELRCSNQRYLSFLIYQTEVQATAYTQIFAYNLDLTTGEPVTLEDLLGPDYQAIAGEAVQAEMDRRVREEDAVYFTADLGGFSGITAGQLFCLDESGNPVILFQKYEVAPGFMGQQEFTVPIPEPSLQAGR